MSSLKTIVSTLALLYLTFYLPLSVLVYSENAYHINHQISGEPVELKDASITFGVADLVTYFTHSDELDKDFWSKKELRHYAEVRASYDFLAIMAILAIFLLGLSRGIISWKMITIFDGVVILLIGGILSCFGWFWDHVFHPFLFTNDDWMMDSTEVSYWLFPDSFFIAAVCFLLLSSLFLQGVLFLSLRMQRRYLRKRLRTLA